MKKYFLALTAVVALMASQVQKAEAHGGCGIAGAVVGGLVAGSIIAHEVDCHPGYYAPSYYVAPVPTYVAPAPAVVYQPAPVVVAPPPVVYVRPAPVVVYGGYYGCGPRYYGGYCRPGYRRW